MRAKQKTILLAKENEKNPLQNIFHFVKKEKERKQYIVHAKFVELFVLENKVE
jgi:hypothetical protein